jgi:hypothetical protein
MSIAARKRLHACLALLGVLAVVAAGCTPADESPSQTPAATIAATSPEPSIATAPSASAPPLAAGPASTPSGRPSDATPSQEAAAEAPPSDGPATEPFSMNLAHRTDFVAQYTFEWCVGASLQMALNM